VALVTGKGLVCQECGQQFGANIQAAEAHHHEGPREDFTNRPQAAPTHRDQITEQEAPEAQPEGPACPECNGPMPVHSGRGRPPTYCSTKCRSKAYRKNKKAKGKKRKRRKRTKKT
jgi:hypothetical protein